MINYVAAPFLGAEAEEKSLQGMHKPGTISINGFETMLHLCCKMPGQLTLELRYAPFPGACKWDKFKLDAEA